MEWTDDGLRQIRNFEFADYHRMDRYSSASKQIFCFVLFSLSGEFYV